MILKQGHTYRAMPHDGKTIRRIYRGGRCYYIAGPYSPEATQALKAAFPQYWTAIRDYGYAHPQLVPFINEDPMLIVSLVEVGKTRWLENSGGAKVSVPNVVIKYGDSIYLKWKGLTDLSAAKDVVMIGIFTCGSWGGTSNIHIANQHKQWGNKQVRYGFLTSGDCYQNPTHEYTVDKVYDCQFGKAVAKVNGVSLNAKALGTSDCDRTTATMLLCSEETSAAMTDVIIKNEAGDIKYHFSPFSTKAEGAGMLDLVSLQFYPNANTEGSFTIEITDKE